MNGNRFGGGFPLEYGLTLCLPMFIAQFLGKPIQPCRKMKPFGQHIISLPRALALFFFLVVLRQASFSQGRVVINEYLHWPSNSCPATAEYVELFNFGPGPVNIGCYILTDGDFSVTIPPNTILLPGQYYLLGGMSVISASCSGTGSPVSVNLNWNNCNCTSGPIPTTGDGFFSQGGNASEQIVLLSPTLQVIDALVNKDPEPSSPITTSSLGGACSSVTFDLDTMNIGYERMNVSTGNANAYGRKLNGTCAWEKQTATTPGTENNAGGTTYSYSVSFAVTNATACPNTGEATAIIQTSSPSTVYPIQYTLARDANLNYEYDINDDYWVGSQQTGPNVVLQNLQPGRYRFVLATAQGCDLRTFDFVILTCNAILPIQLKSFSAQWNRNGFPELKWTIAQPDPLAEVVVEHSSDGLNFLPIHTRKATTGLNSQNEVVWVDRHHLQGGYYRLSITHYLGGEQRNRSITVSPTVRLSNTSTGSNANNTLKVHRNSVGSDLLLFWQNQQEQQFQISLVNTMGQVVHRETTGRLLAGSIRYPLQLKGSRRENLYLVVQSLDNPAIQLRARVPF